MKALIPVAGVGTRLRPHTYTQPKPLIPVAGKPIISFIIDQLREIGINEFVFVIGYLGEKIKNYIETKYPDIDKEFVYQQERQGLGHAVWMARESFVKEEDIIIVLGDTIFEADLKEMLDSSTSCLGIKKVKDPRNFGVAEFGEDGYVNKVVEKPMIPKSNMALVGLYRIKQVHELFQALSYNIENDIKTIGEYQLTDAIMRMIEQGIRFQTVAVSNWFDCGQKDILLETNAILLKKRGFASNDIPNYNNSIIIHPVSIGKDCEINNSIVGPNVTIGDHATIDYSIVKDSIIGNYAAIEEVVLYRSVVGNDSYIRGLSQSLNIGDNTEIDFGEQLST